MGHHDHGESQGRHAGDSHADVTDLMGRLLAGGPTPLPESLSRLQLWMKTLEAREQTGIGAQEMTLAIQHHSNPNKAPEVVLVFGKAEVVSRGGGK